MVRTTWTGCHDVRLRVEQLAVQVRELDAQTAADAKAAAERMIGRRETYMSGAA